jgi:hypothetical protein
VVFESLDILSLSSLLVESIASVLDDIRRGLEVQRYRKIEIIVPHFVDTEIVAHISHLILSMTIPDFTIMPLLFACKLEFFGNS